MEWFYNILAIRFHYIYNNFILSNDYYIRLKLNLKNFKVFYIFITPKKALKEFNFKL